MKLIKMGCAGYKPFRNQVDIDLAPLTIFFGRNNSGKTALLRLPRLLLRCLSSNDRNNFPLDVDELTFGESFRDLIHTKLPSGHIDLSIIVEDAGENFALDARVQDVLSEEYQVVSSLHIKNPELSLKWDGKGGRPSSYNGQGPIEFHGLLPKIDDKVMMGDLNSWSQKVRLFEDSSSHLGAHRSPISRVYEFKTPRILGLDGKSAPEWLAKYFELLKAVGDWYELNMDGWRFSLDRSGEFFRCVLRRGNVEVNLADTGDGMQLLLPVVVQQLLHFQRNELSFIDLIEEPELHLHPAAHASLADLFLQTVKQGKGQVIIETHSETLLLRLRRRI
ncbi:MAG: hypothetical protein D3923_18325, partial [Candidatus Electrothrix sp. AR3]|nr:hypothetical protein [Candidatus Electrothrix sp. AR3]